jgi:hypothetical protein
MLFMPRITSNLLAASAAALCLLFAPASQAESSTAKKDATQVEAEFRGCVSAGWCRFRIDSPDGLTESLIRVRPDGVPRSSGGDATSVAVRNRLNALLSNMIHQAKHIVLRDLHELDDGTFAAVVTVSGVDLAADPVLVELREKAARATR